MNNTEEQKEELEVLRSIYGEEVLIINESNCDGKFMVHPVLPQPLTILLHPEGTAKRELEVGFLPPIVLHFRLPPNYPSKCAPRFVLSCQWLTRTQLSLLCRHLDELWKESKPEVVLYRWIQFLQEDALVKLNLASQLDITPLVADTARNFGSLSMSLNRMNSLTTEDCVEENGQDGENTEKRGVNKIRTTKEVAHRHLKTKRFEDRDNEEDNKSKFRGRGRGIKLNQENATLLPHNVHRTKMISDEELLKNLNISSEFSQKESSCQVTMDDPRAVVDLKPDVSPLPLIVEFNESRQREIFNREWFTCKVCLNKYLGVQCLQFVGCHHVFCKSCMRIYFEVQIKEGNVRLLTCPEEKCSSQATPSQVYELVGQELFDRYDRMLLESSLATMGDVMYCPRASCQFIVYKDRSENYAMCERCLFVFCHFCQKTYHGVAPCRFRHEEKFGIIKEYQSGNTTVKHEMERRYGKKQLTAMIDETMSEQWVKEYTKKCPSCSASIQKIDGCNKMVCWRCNTYFCWLCMRHLDSASPYTHFNEAKSPCFNLLFEGAHEMEDEDWEFGQFI